MKMQHIKITRRAESNPSIHLKSFEVSRLIKLLRIEADKHYDGHFTILSFTTNYKVAFGTPDLNGGGYFQVWALKSFPDLKDALIDCLVNKTNFNDLDVKTCKRRFLEDM